MSNNDSKPHTQQVGGLSHIRKYSMPLEVPMWPTPASQGLSLFKGWGIIPLILNPDEARIDSEEIRKELFTFLNRCRGTTTSPT